MCELKSVDRSVARWFCGLVCELTTVPFPLYLNKKFMFLRRASHIRVIHQP
jgi:hypothetical protein